MWAEHLGSMLDVIALAMCPLCRKLIRQRYFLPTIIISGIALQALANRDSLLCMIISTVESSRGSGRFWKFFVINKAV